MTASEDPADTTPRVMAEQIAQFASETGDDVCAHLAAAWALLDVADAIREATSKMAPPPPRRLTKAKPTGACECGHWADMHVADGPCRTPRCDCEAFTEVV